MSWQIVAKYSDRKPTLIFCESKKATESLATKLSDSQSVIASGRPSVQQQQRARGAMEKLGNVKLKELVMSGVGIAFHHAGMSSEDRATVEQLFQEGLIRILCSTSTLSGERLQVQFLLLYWYSAS